MAPLVLEMFDVDGRITMVPLNILALAMSSQSNWRGKSQSPMRTPQCGLRTVASPQFQRVLRHKCQRTQPFVCRCAGATGQMHSHTKDGCYNTRAEETQRLRRCHPRASHPWATPRGARRPRTTHAQSSTVRRQSHRVNGAKLSRPVRIKTRARARATNHGQRRLCQNRDVSARDSKSQW